MRSAASRKAIIAFERPSYQSDGYGNDRGSFEEIFRCYGRLVPRTGGEAINAARLGGVQPYSIEVRSSDRVREVDSSWRLKIISCTGFGMVRTGSLFNIRSVVNPDQRGRWIELLAETGRSVAT